MKTETLYPLLAAVVLSMLIPFNGFAQSGQNSATSKPGSGAPPKATLEAAIRKVIQDYEDALARRDLPAILAYYADDGMFYDSDEGRTSGARLKQLTREAFDYYTKNNVKDAFELKDLFVQQLSNDLALANYVEVLKRTTDGKTEVLRMAETDIFAFRNGRWVEVAGHTEGLPKEVAPRIPGLPTEWARSTNSAAADYITTVDTAIHHNGKASVSLRFVCGADPLPWVGLTQDIDASWFKGKRVRLSGFIKTVDSEGAGLWLRADGERKMLAFDNMQEREVKGTTDWKHYEIVLDIPESAVLLVYGPYLSGKGQAWFDDISIEVVGADVPVTTLPIDANNSKEYSENVKRSYRTAPANLGFENGVIK